MKFRVMFPDYEDKIRPVNIWTEIEADSEQAAAIEYSTEIEKDFIVYTEEREEIEVWVQSDRLYKFKVWVEIKYNAEEISK